MTEIPQVRWRVLGRHQDHQRLSEVARYLLEHKAIVRVDDDEQRLPGERVKITRVKAVRLFTSDRPLPVFGIAFTARRNTSQVVPHCNTTIEQSLSPLLLGTRCTSISIYVYPLVQRFNGLTRIMGRYKNDYNYKDKQLTLLGFFHRGETTVGRQVEQESPVSRKFFETTRQEYLDLAVSWFVEQILVWIIASRCSILGGIRTWPER